MKLGLATLTINTWQFLLSTLHSISHSNTLAISLPLVLLRSKFLSNVCNAASIATFRKKLKTYLFSKAFLPYWLLHKQCLCRFLTVSNDIMKEKVRVERQVKFRTLGKGNQNYSIFRYLNRIEFIYYSDMQILTSK